jgi:hypothetical protein
LQSIPATTLNVSVIRGSMAQSFNNNLNSVKITSTLNSAIKSSISAHEIISSVDPANTSTLNLGGI